MSDRFTKGIRDESARVAKLPAWAQSLIELQAMRLREAGRAFDQLAGETGETPIIVDHYNEGRFCLRPDATVRFMLDEHRYVDVRLDRQDRELLVLNSGRSLNIFPRAANVVHVTDERP